MVRTSIPYRRTVRPCSGLASIACLDYLFSLIHWACLIAVVLDLRGAHDMLVVSDIEQSHARRFAANHARSDEHTSELQSLMRISYAVFFLQQIYLLFFFLFFFSFSFFFF